jgi:hypothetical protein
MKKIFLSLFFAIIFFGFSAKISFATSDLIVTPEKTPLFSEGNDRLWMPGYFLTRTVYVKNNSSETKLVAITPSNFLDNPRDLSNQMTIAIHDNFGNKLYGDPVLKSLSDFYTLTEYPLSYLLPLHDVTYGFTVNLDGPTTGNEWQNKKTGFDLTIGFSSETPKDSPTPTPTTENQPGPTNTPQPGPTNTPGPGNTPTPTPITETYIPTYYQGEIIDVPVLGAQTSSTPSPTKTIQEKILGTEKGSVLGTCANPWWWWLLYSCQIAFQFITFKKTKKVFTKRILFAEIVSGILCGFIFWKFFCQIIFAIISIVISIFFIILTLRKIQIENNN